MQSSELDEKVIFNIARQLDSPEARAEYLQQVGSDNPALVDRVNALLAGLEKQESFLESPVARVAATIDQPVTEKPGVQIGPYKLLQEIGEGGMGVVYMADQKEPVKRRVALKVIKPGMDSRHILARFEAERQALAMMDHPNVARVLDAGTTDNGRPYFVMELVKGISITNYCDDNHLTTRQRLQLFVSVCQAVQHAHHKGIIHRDLKPSNVLVACYDDQPVPKIIDFGVAKALNQSLTEKTMFTQFGQIVGTLEYMSPEQAKLNQLDVDTRSDVYSLGVLLYELLTGTTPFDGERLRSTGLDELLRIIGEEEPPKPSTRLAMSDTLPAVAAGRATDARRLTGLIRGDLDWIVMKAISKERSDRYETASALADDVRCHLDDQPILARRPSVIGRVRRFARRNRGPVGLATVAAVALVATVTLGIHSYVAHQRQLARDLEQQLAQKVQEDQDRARETLAEARRRMEDGKIVAAFRIARDARHFLSDDDPVLKPLWDELTSPLTLESNPPGARAWIRDWDDPNGEWVELGETPLENADLPTGAVRWRLEKAEYVTREMVRDFSDRDRQTVRLFEPMRDDMVAVFGHDGSRGSRILATRPFLIDRFEVTNARYQEFVDAGGYQMLEFWRHEFMQDGKVISREEAMRSFIDQTGQPGPAGWSHGRFPPGEEDHPVHGVSWYEAAAYAEFRGKRLPTVHHWAALRGGGFAKYIVPHSNFFGEGPDPVGSNDGIGLYDVYDLAGNVAEWCFNEEKPGIRCLRGGAWDDPNYMFIAMDHGHAMDREPGYGFRCALFSEDDSGLAKTLEPVIQRVRTFTEPPASDEIMEFVFQRFDYKSDAPPLNGEVIDAGDQVAHPEYIHEVVRINAAYEDERFDVHLYTPRDAEGPYETVVWVPGSGAFQSESFAERRDQLEIRFQSELLATGRAVCLPVCKGMFERGNGRFRIGRDRFSQLVRDVRRTVDYLETRPTEFDNERLIFGGLSYGARIGPIVTVVEDRFAAAILINGGYAWGEHSPEMDPYNFNHRLRIPVLMINGRFDALFPVEESQLPFFNHLGTPAEHKKLIHFDGGHSLPSKEAVEEMDRWLQLELPRRADHSAE